MKTKMKTRTDNWIRREWTTRCADPTVVVEWRWQDGRQPAYVVLTEFFGDVSVECGPGSPHISEQLGQAMHRMLEEQYSLTNMEEFVDDYGFWGGE